jgi:formylglycine-generating enzyme required for sulfatase activity
MRTAMCLGVTLTFGTSAIAQMFPERDPADVNGDGVINAVDLAAVLGKWGPAPQPWAIVLEQCPDPNVVTDDQLREAIAATGLPWRVHDVATGIEMLLVPPGTFMMGCSPSEQYECNSDENPVHEVTLTQAFYLGRYEVTQAQWTAVMGSNPSHHQGYPDSPSRPVERVSWEMIQPFLAATALRLPTEAEWEYACRAGTTSAFHNGSDDDSTIVDYAWFGSTSGNVTHPVGQKLPNRLGHHDMLGNVFEWVADWYGPYPGKPQVDPVGPPSGPVCVVRGGNYDLSSDWLRSSRRRATTNNSFQSSSRGFRVARTP